MDICNKAVDFFMEQKSTKAVVEHFIEQFMEVYEDLRPKERELVAQCIHPLFRRYYYTELLPDTYATYASLVNARIEKECGKDIMLFPILKPKYRGKKIQRIDYNVACFQLGQHGFVTDMEAFLDIAKEGILMEELGILHQSEYGKIKDKVTIDDRHYYNIITMTAIDAGLVQNNQEDDGHFFAKTTDEAAAFLSLGNKDRLQFIIDAAMKYFSKIMSEDFPDLDLFSADNMAGMLRKSVDFDELFRPIAKKLKIDQDLLAVMSGEDFMDYAPDLTEKEMEQLASVIHLLASYDMFFLTPFAHYLQLIQLIYAGNFVMEDVIDDLLEAENIQMARTKLYIGIASYDLTPLGEALLGRGRKPKRKFGISEVPSDEEALEIIEYIEEGDFADFDDDYDYDESDDDDESGDEVDLDEDGNDFSDNEQMNIFDLEDFRPSVNDLFTERLNDKGKVLTFNADNRMYTFKVKSSRKRGSAKHIQLKGSQTLDDLHQAIFHTFDLEPGHLYSFFMSNKVWDSKTEYSHPAGDGRPAVEAVIGKLALELNQRFLYLYDYNDEIKFEIQVNEPEL